MINDYCSITLLIHFFIFQSSDSETSGEYLPTNSGFATLGFCPKNQSSDDSDAIEISRPPIEITVRQC